MRNDDPVEQFAASVYGAIHRDLPDRRTTVRDRIVYRRPYTSEINIVSWVQQWGSTALGFDAPIAGAAISTAMVVVVECGNRSMVYMGGRLAYSVYRDGDPSFKSAFEADLRDRSIADQSEAVQKYGATIPGT